jgi:3',5'-nucleoside bisphosphate phosphatase
MNFVDLHMHSTASDGTLSPVELARAVLEAGLTAFVLTDHDTTLGCAAAGEEAKRLGLDFLPGIEISCEFPRPGTLHLLGYGVDAESAALRGLTTRLLKARGERNARLVRLLSENGFAITEEEVRAKSGAEGGGTIGRPHIAAVLVEKGYVESMREAFGKLIGAGAPFYLDKEQVSSRQAIEMIREAGGIAVLAHPSQLRRENFAQLRTVVKDLADQGLGGVETLHGDHRESLVEELEEITRRFGLLATGGSDFHGGVKAHVRLGQAGRRRIPRERFEALRERLGR